MCIVSTSLWVFKDLWGSHFLIVHRKSEKIIEVSCVWREAMHGECRPRTKGTKKSFRVFGLLSSLNNAPLLRTLSYINFSALSRLASADKIVCSYSTKRLNFLISVLCKDCVSEWDSQSCLSPDCAKHIDYFVRFLSPNRKINRLLSSKTYLLHSTSPCSPPDRNNHCFAGSPRSGSCFCYMHASLSYGKHMFHRKQRPTFAILSYSVLRLFHTDCYMNPRSPNRSQRSFEHYKGEESFFAFFFAFFFATKILCALRKRSSLAKKLKAHSSTLL